jgi:hypothetical protein
LLKLEHHTCLSRASRTGSPGAPSRWSDTCYGETPTDQHIIYNIQKGLFGTRVVLCKRLISTCPGVPLPLPRPPKEKNYPQPTQNVFPSNFPSPVLCPRDRSHRQSLSTSPVQRTPAKGFTPSNPRTSKRPRVDATKNTNLKPACHRTGTTTVTRPTQKVTYVIRGSSFPPQESDPTKRARATFPKPTQLRRESSQ